MNKQNWEKEFEKMRGDDWILDTEDREANIKTFINKLIQEQRADIIKWAEEYIERDKKIYGTDKHGIALEDLINKIQL